MGLSCLFWLLFRCGTVDLPPHRSSYEGGSGHGQVEFPRLSLGLSFSRLPRTRADSLLVRFLFLHHLTLPYLLFFSYLLPIYSSVPPCIGASLYLARIALA
jgi:hypothetical protein